jgi:hypothetical protein
MGKIDRETSSRTTSGPPTRSWPPWARALMSLFLAFHMAAILTAALAVSPSSAEERRAAMAFRSYNDLINQGYGYHYYARLDTTVDPHDPRPWSTPIVIAEMEFDGDGPSGPRRVEVRLPGRVGERAWPRLRHQRQLDLAYHLTADPRWAASYARHLCKAEGCKRVAIYTQEHRIPDLGLMREAASHPGAPRVDLEEESLYGPRVKLGEFRCDEF